MIFWMLALSATLKNKSTSFPKLWFLFFSSYALHGLARSFVLCKRVIQVFPLHNGVIRVLFIGALISGKTQRM
jgi:membrane-bound metal-dependent hydrolase YbcI (DUF457 family)